MWDGHTEGDPAEPLPGDGVGHFPAERLETEPVAVLQEHEPQVGLDRHRGPTEDCVEVGPERLEERGIIEQPVHGLELSGHPKAHLGEERLPQGGLRVYRSQHGGLDPY